MLDNVIDFVQDYIEEIILGLIVLICGVSIFMNYNTLNKKNDILSYYKLNEQLANAAGDTFDHLHEINYPIERSEEIIDKSSVMAAYNFISDVSNMESINSAYNFARVVDDEIGITEESYAKAMLENLSSSPLGTFGRIAIPDIGMNLPVYNNDLDLLSKMITERITGIVAVQNGKQIMFNDLFDNAIPSLSRVVEGKTQLLFVNNKKQIIKFICSKKTDGKIMEGQIYDMEGTDVSLLNRDGFMLYSKSQNGSVVITLWEQSKEQ